ncbi:hypothetical protein Y1Q_0016145 [Alligator mississippiensis]|uniref:Uncharacterized protein n=1 Tax=Alligator mississippiensis TaxID=8496 RepID=A0A151P0W6_ALLMI|nr:hypothetical protein Y1Q_0016145 [Alligator mississippiensis]
MHIDELHDELEEWQQKCIQAELLAKGLREKLLESHAQTEKTTKAVTQEMGKVREFLANYEVLRERNLVLEKELETKGGESEELQAQLKRGAVEKDLCEEQIWALKALLEESSAKEAATDIEREQLRQQIQTSRQQVQALEEENETLQEQKQSLLMELGASTKEGVELRARLQEAEEIQSLKTLFKESTTREQGFRL